MKVICKVNCTGMGYENFNIDEVRDIKKDIAETLIDFGYADKIEKGKEKVG